MKEADSLAAGATAQDVVAVAIAPLGVEGWKILSDRVTPTGGNIDHIVIGPGSVIVVGAEAWNGMLGVGEDRLYEDGWSQATVLQKLTVQRDAVRGALADLIGPEDPVDMALVVTTQPDFGPERVDAAIVLGIGHLLDGIRSSRLSYTPSDVEAMTDRLEAEFPAMADTPAKTDGARLTEVVLDNEVAERAERFLFVDVLERRRVHIRGENGESLGDRDLHDGSNRLDDPTDVIVEAVLAASNALGVNENLLQIPELPIEPSHGGSISLSATIHTTVIIGSLWQSGRRRCLYGTLANPTEGSVDLGYVDLVTGELHPAASGPLSRDRSLPERYLALLSDRHPFDDHTVS